MGDRIKSSGAVATTDWAEELMKYLAEKAPVKVAAKPLDAKDLDGTTIQ